MQRRKVVTAAAGLLGAAAAGPMAAAPAGAAPAAPALRLGQIRLVTLSHVNDPAQTFIFPGDPSFTLSTAATIEQDGYYLQYVQEGEHTGSHWGAPGHFNPDVGIDDTFGSSTLLYENRRISLGNMANLELLPTTGAWVLPGGPINRRGSGSPAHIFGLIPAPH